MEWLRKTWARWSLAAALVVAVAVLVLAPGGRLFFVDLAYNLIRAFAALVMLETVLRYSTRKIAEGLEPLAGDPRAPPGGLRFADIFLVMYGHPIGLAIFIAAGLIARAQIVVAVWK